MNQTAAIWLLMLVALVTANLPFINHRWMALGPLVKGTKTLGWRMGELLLWYVVCLGIGFALEASIGRRHVQSWEFYVVTACLFAVLAFPGFVWRYLMRHRDD